ncbi:MAG TPA: AprI/Inh family metalloprotease inhibitor [Xanthobacteraceae bacterium]|nr:AprI/Inh family metalloprotease inhibitor [Xanthobacteraceae bacterium]
MIDPASLVRCALLALACCLPLGAARGQLNETVESLVGAWEMSNADHDQTCMITLKAETGGAGYKLEFEKGPCVAQFPPLAGVSAWTLTSDSSVRLVDAKGKVIYDFTEVESGMYESLRPGQPLTFLQSAASVAATVRTVEQMMGDWSVQRGSGEVCVMTLSNTPASPGEMAMQVKPGCDAAVMRFGPVTWQMDHGELVMKSARGQIWRFEDNNGVWERRVPREAESVILSKR